MLGRFGGKGVVEDLMYRFCDRRPVVRVLRATFGTLEPELSDRLKDEAEHPGRHWQWPGTSGVRRGGTQSM